MCSWFQLLLGRLLLSAFSTTSLAILSILTMLGFFGCLALVGYSLLVLNYLLQL